MKRFARCMALSSLTALGTACAPVAKVDLPGLLTGGRDGWQHPERVVRSLGLAEGDRVAEIGAGDGYWLPYLSSAVGREGVVFAVEVEDDKIAELEERVSREALENVVIVRGRYEDPELPDGEIDLAMTCLTYHHIEGQIAYFERLRTDLAAGGRVAHLDDRHDTPAPIRWIQGEHTSDAAVIVSEMEAAGYRRTESFEFLPVQSFQIFEPRTEADAR